MGGVRTLVVRCPDWPVLAAGYAASAPVAVVFANRVVACSVAARADGVVIGLRRREAQGRSPELVVVDQDPGREAKAFEPVMAAIERFTPGVEVTRPGVAAFATRGPSRYFGGDQALAGQVAGTVDAILAPLGAPRCRIGVADGPFAAEQAARIAAAHQAGSETDRPTAIVVPPRGSASFLGPLPVGVLECPDLVDLLVRLGLRTLGDFAALPADMVLARFGTEGARAHRLARGLDERSLAARTPPPDLAVTAELDPPADRVDTAAFAAKALADQLHQRLATLGLACTRVAIEAETEHGEHLVRLWRHEGTLTAKATAERVRWQLDGWLSSGATTAGLARIRLIPDEVKADNGRQLGFWGSSAAADERAARTFARIQGLLGPDGVSTAVVGGGRDPAGQVRLIPWGEPRQPTRPGPANNSRPSATGQPRRPRRTMGAAADEMPPWPGRLPVPAPAMVYRRPLAAELRDADGAQVTVTARGLASAPPAVLSVTGGPPSEVTTWAGPWPAEERWWDPVSFRRRARFQLGLASGVAHVVALESGRWWVDATYD